MAQCFAASSGKCGCSCHRYIFIEVVSAQEETSSNSTPTLRSLHWLWWFLLGQVNSVEAQQESEVTVGTLQSASKPGSSKHHVFKDCGRMFSLNFFISSR